MPINHRLPGPARIAALALLAPLSMSIVGCTTDGAQSGVAATGAPSAAAAASVKAQEGCAACCAVDTKTAATKPVAVADAKGAAQAVPAGEKSAYTHGGVMENVTNKPAPAKPAEGTLGEVERLAPKLDALLADDARMEKLAQGLDWSEGPVWDRKQNALLFSDVPQNVVWKWKDGEGVGEYLRPSGYTGTEPRGGEPGSNGLTFGPQGDLVLAQHGDRRVARWNAEAKKFETIADNYEGKKFNSPNDVVYDSRGNLYFTDPPYGLPKNVDDPTKELPFQGVYKVSPDGKVTLLTKEMSRPNGIALSPDEKTLYVANSDPKKAVWMAFPIKADGTVGEGKVFFDATKMVGRENKGLPDGLKVDRSGNLWATGPGGVLVFAPDGTHLGTLRTGEATANVAFGDDGSTLYIMADQYVARIKTKAKGW